MKKLLFGLLAPVALCGAVVSARADTVYPYVVTDLGTMGWPGSGADGLNNSGDVTGYLYGSPNSGDHAFVYTASGGMRDLGTLPGVAADTSYWPGAINSVGQVVGWTSNPDGGGFAFLFTPGGGIQTIGTFGGPAAADGINDAGQIVGAAQVSNGGLSHAFVYSGDTATDLGTFGGLQSAAFGINNSGQVVGVANLPTAGNAHAFFYSGQGAIQDIGALIGAQGNNDYSEGDAINDRGQMLGQFIDAGGDWHSFIWSAANGITIPALPASASGIAMNNLGQIVGTALGMNEMPFAFLYDQTDGMQTLNGLVELPAGWTITDARGINDHGQIACTETGPDGAKVAVLLTPTPEPSSLALAACALSLLMFWGAWRQRRLWATRQACVHLQRHIRGQRPLLLERGPLFRRTYDQNWRLFHEEVAC